VNGKPKREGRGCRLLFFTAIGDRSGAAVERDVPFVLTSQLRFSGVTIQGQLTYRVADPKRLAQLLDFSVQSNGRYVSDVRKIGERLVARRRCWPARSPIA